MLGSIRFRSLNVLMSLTAYRQPYMVTRAFTILSPIHVRTLGHQYLYASLSPIQFDIFVTNKLLAPRHLHACKTLSHPLPCKLPLPNTVHSQIILAKVHVESTAVVAEGDRLEFGAQVFEQPRHKVLEWVSVDRRKYLRPCWSAHLARFVVLIIPDVPAPTKAIGAKDHRHRIVDLERTLHASV